MNGTFTHLCVQCGWRAWALSPSLFCRRFVGPSHSMKTAIKFAGLLTEWARDLFVISWSQIIGLVITVLACGAGASYAFSSWPILRRASSWPILRRARAQIRDAPPLSTCKSQIREAPSQPLSVRQRERARHRWKWVIRSVIRWLRVRRHWGRTGQSLKADWNQNLFKHLNSKQWGQPTWLLGDMQVVHMRHWMRTQARTVYSAFQVSGWSRVRIAAPTQEEER